MKEEIVKTIKCAIYTRKSTDEGLEKEFNTLEAQREAGLNYVKSQVHQGWEVLSEHYDDGGYSGGNMNRPALKRLFEDIRAGKVDMIVVYKIDRLTRSLTDFSKMMELFDEYNVSFVSVTQNFNTYDSMSRLTLNVLLSFAQFEREVSGERIRDKISASKKKGMWMGGPLPLGYDLQDKKLVINPDEAEVVRLMFEKYLVCKSPQYLADWLNSNGYRTKSKVTKKGKVVGGKQFDRARPEPDISPEPDPQTLTTKENKPENNFKRKENYTRRQNFSDPNNGGFVSLGAIFARQMEPPAKKYHFNTFPPDRAEVEMYIREKALEVNPEHFFDYYERHDWCDRKYRKLDGWHFALHHLARNGTYI